MSQPRVVWVVEVHLDGEWLPKAYLLPFRLSTYKSRAWAVKEARESRAAFPDTRYRVAKYVRA